MKRRRYGRTRIVAIALLFVIAASFSLTFVGVFAPEDIVWSGDTRLTWNEALDESPSIMQGVDGSIWVVWSSDREHSYNDLYIANSSDYGTNWLNHSLTSDFRFWDTNPSIIQANDESIWVVWGRTEMATPTTYDIYYSYSVGYGENWEPAKNITDPSTHDENPSIMEDSDGRIWVAWCRVVESNREIFYKYSSDHGENWSPDTPLITHPGTDKAPSIMQAFDGSIWIAWASHRTGETVDYEIFYSYTYDYGVNWSSETLLTNQTGYDENPSIIQARNGSIFVFWHSDRINPNDSTSDLYYEISGDMGQTWSKPLGQRGNPLSTEAEQDVSPSAANIDDGTVWVVWSSNRVTEQHVEFEVFHKNSSLIPTRDVAITSVTPSLTDVVYAGQTVNITVVVRNEGDFTESFSVTTKYDDNTIETQEVTDLPPYTNATLTFIWNTTGVTPCFSYTIKAEASIVPDEPEITDNLFLDGEIHVKIPGDIDYSGIVDIFDAILLRKHIWHEPPNCPLWLDVECIQCDINYDGIVDVFDALIVGAHFWETCS